MINPQIENGHVDIANEIAEHLCGYRISGEEWMVLWVIIRKTYGWRKKEDRISLSQFAKVTGLKRQTASRAINKLASKKIIGVIKNDDSGINVYCFNKHFDEWGVSSKKITVSSKKIRGVIKKDNRVSSKKMPTKDTITKDTITKDKYTADFLSFYDLYPNKKEKKAAFKSWQKLNGTRPPIEKILKAIRDQINWREDADDDEFRPEWKHPATWINKGCWEDEFQKKEGNLDKWLREGLAKKQAESDAVKTEVAQHGTV